MEEGAAYEVENVLVTRNDPKYGTTLHKFRLNLIDKTKFTKIDAAKIPDNHFDFVSFAEILESDKEERIIGTFCINPKLVKLMFCVKVCFQQRCFPNQVFLCISNS